MREEGALEKHLCSVPCWALGEVLGMGRSLTAPPGSVHWGFQQVLCDNVRAGESQHERRGGERSMETIALQHADFLIAAWEHAFSGPHRADFLAEGPGAPWSGEGHVVASSSSCPGEGPWL